MMRASVLLAAIVAAGCTPRSETALSSVRFAPVTKPQGVARANRQLAEDFLDLTFTLESGEKIQGLLRYEAPVRVHLVPGDLDAFRVDLEALLSRLRDEAGIDIAQTRTAARAQIRIEAVPAAEIARVFPNAACFIVPGGGDWRSFVRGTDRARPRWTEQHTLRGAAIYLPRDTTPQDLRDCLHEEITQALGPANDLYRLPDSIWNDDNYHGIATPFDMLMLQTLYQPELRSGMTRAEAAQIVPGLLARLNPDGQRIPGRDRHPESRVWADTIEIALAQRVPRSERRGAARLATGIASEMRPVDHRLGVSLHALGRMELRDAPLTAAQAFAEAYNLATAQFGSDDIRTAQAAVHLTAIAVATEQYAVALKLSERHVPPAITAQNAVLIAALLALKAEALAGLGDQEASRRARLDSLRWARYGFGDADGSLARRQAELASARAPGGN